MTLVLLPHGSVLSVVGKDVIQENTVLCPFNDLSGTGTQSRPQSADATAGRSLYGQASRSYSGITSGL